MELGEELISKGSIKKKNYATQSFNRLKSRENVTSIGERMMNLEDLVRELLLSSNIYLNENQIQSIVEYDLSNMNIVGNNRMSDKKALQMSLRGYLGIINELLFMRHTLLQKLEENLGIYINIFSRKKENLTKRLRH